MCKRIVSVVLTVLIAILATACQPTPEDSLIVNKTGDEINSLIHKEATGPVIADGRITEKLTLCGDRVVANVDAQIKSQYDYYGIYEIERKTITQAQVDKAIELLYGDRKIWDYRGQQVTKADCEFYIELYESMLDDMKKNRKKYEEEIKNNPNNVYESVEAWMASVKAQLDEQKRQLKTAPTEEELTNSANKKLHYPAKGEYGMQGNSKVKMIMLSADMGKESDSTLIVNVPDNINSLNSSVYLTYTDGSSEGLHTIDSITNEEALELAEQFALAMDKNFVLTRNRVDSNEAGGTYSFTFCIGINGMPISKRRIMSDYERGWNTGEMLISVDDSGISGIQWTEPIKVTKTVNDKVDMISAEQAYKTFMNYFKLQYASDSLYGDFIKKRIFDIYEISVSYVIEPIKDNSNIARVMPCWDFICKDTVKQNNDAPDSIAERVSIIAVNAIDGSIILNK